MHRARRAKARGEAIAKQSLGCRFAYCVIVFDIDDARARAEGDAKVAIGPSLKPSLYLRIIGRGLGLPALEPGMLPSVATDRAKATSACRLPLAFDNAMQWNNSPALGGIEETQVQGASLPIAIELL
jgi:hypothetical protein